MDDRIQRERVLRGEVQIIFIGPEMLMRNTTWREMLRTPVYQSNLVAFVIDEVHCVTKWLEILSTLIDAYFYILFLIGVITFDKNSKTLVQ